MEQSFIEKIFDSYVHLKGRYIGCFCKDQMDKLSKAIKLDKSISLHKKTFALINTGMINSNGEHWMGIVMNKQTNSCGFFDSFGRNFSWLEDTSKKHFNLVHKTKHVIQSTSSSTCGLHTLHFITKMMDPMNKSNYAKM